MMSSCVPTHHSRWLMSPVGVERPTRTPEGPSLPTTPPPTTTKSPGTVMTCLTVEANWLVRCIQTPVMARPEASVVYPTSVVETPPPAVAETVHDRVVPSEKVMVVLKEPE